MTRLGPLVTVDRQSLHTALLRYDEGGGNYTQWARVTCAWPGCRYVRDVCWTNNLLEPHSVGCPLYGTEED